MPWSSALSPGIYILRRAAHRHIFKRLEIDLAHLRQVGRPVKVVAIWHDMTSPERAVIRNEFLYSFCSEAALWAHHDAYIQEKYTYIYIHTYERNAARGIRLADCGARKGLGVFFSGAAAAAMLDVRGSSERVDRPTHCSSQSWSAAQLILFNEARLHSAVSCSCFIIINDSASRWSPVRACRFFGTFSYSNICSYLRICIREILPHAAPHPITLNYVHGEVNILMRYNYFCFTILV